MHSEKFKVLNVKCGGCANIIRTGLLEISDVDTVDVDIESGQVTVTGSTIDRKKISSKLEKLGYPEE
jgi:copper chaperone